jgi:molybdopterin converting factor small subunit
MQIKVLFFGEIFNITGTYARYYNHVVTFNDLMIRVRDDYPGLMFIDYRIAVNGVTDSSGIKLREGDEVALLPDDSTGRTIQY